MAGHQPGSVQEDDNLRSLEESLLSLEKLDRTSPELWPERMPGVSEFVSCYTPPNSSPPSWTKGLTNEDINILHQLGALSMNGLIAEVKKLHDLAYQLGQEEAKEMTRGKYLNIFTNRKNKR
ncbi:protein lin-52 homolog [Chrysoperla carnea]|uniref:protein lin-52 homolog n=1 Tax=Chrysoperla carnea TaxID=189513 RepID=UPI001D07E036|nr:protein lin-52 homolog [Chrysoperla carnea]